jgi:hypothetical protein
MEQTHSWEASSCSATQEIPRFLRSPKIHYPAHKACYWALLWARLIKFKFSHPTSLSHTLILSFHLCLWGGIAQSVLWHAAGWTVGVRFPARANILSTQMRPDGLWDSSSLLYNGYRGVSSPGVKWLEREADHYPPSSGEVKNGGAIPPLHHMS